MLIFLSSIQSVYFNQFFCLLCIYIFLILDHTKPYVEKIPSRDAELAQHAPKLDVKLQSSCRNVFSLFAVRMRVKPYRLGVN